MTDSKPAIENQGKADSDPTTDSGPAEVRHRRAMLHASRNLEQQKKSLARLAKDFPEPETVEVEVDGEMQLELASSFGAVASVSEVRLGAVEFSVLLLDHLIGVLRSAARSTPESVLERQQARAK